MPAFAQASKWFLTVMVPLISPQGFGGLRTLKNCLNVEVPEIDGWFVRVHCTML
jgi:hypothetical protein